MVKVRDWSINFQQSVLSTETLQDTDRTIMPGMRSFTGSGSLLYYAENNSNISLLLKNMVTTGGSDPYAENFGSLGNAGAPKLVRLSLDLNADSSPEAIVFFALLNSFSITCSTGEVVSANFSFEGHGAPNSITF